MNHFHIKYTPLIITYIINVVKMQLTLYLLAKHVSNLISSISVDFLAGDVSTLFRLLKLIFEFH